MTFIASIRNLLIALAIGIAVGFGAGYYVKAKFTKAAIVETVIEQRKADVSVVVEMQKQEKILQKEVESSEKKSTAIRNQIKRGATHVKKPIAVPEKQGESTVELSTPEAGCPERVLANRTVWLLNDARADRASDSAAWVDAESEAPSSVTDAAFIDNDLEIVGLYHDLAKRHDALVDWAEKEITKHNGAIQAN